MDKKTRPPPVMGVSGNENISRKSTDQPNAMVRDYENAHAHSPSKGEKMNCNHDCFNCPYPDCIEDEITDEEVELSEMRDGKVAEIIKALPKVEQKKIRDREYYLRNREKRLAYQKKYNKTNKKRIAEHRRQTFLERREEICAERRVLSPEDEEMLRRKIQSRILFYAEREDKRQEFDRMLCRIWRIE